MDASVRWECMNTDIETTQTAGSKNKLLLALQKTYQRFLKIRGNPHEIALGFALGLFIGMTPFMGFHTAIAIFFAALLKWNKISAAVGVWISNPITAPVIYPFTFFIGAKLTGISNGANPADGYEFAIFDMLLKAPMIVLALVIGGVVIGIPVAIAGYYISFSAVNNYRKRIKEKLLHQKKLMSIGVRKRRVKLKRKKKKKKKR